MESTSSESIVLGGQSSDHLIISEIEWAFPGATIEFDRTMVEAVFELKTGPWHVVVKGQLPHSQLVGLSHSLDALYSSLVGSASLSTWEPPLVFIDMEGDGQGHITLSGEIQEGWGLQNRLTYSLPPFDQTYVPAIRAAVEATLRRLEQNHKAV